MTTTRSTSTFRAKVWEQEDGACQLVSPVAFILKGPALCLCPRFVFWAASVHICLLLRHPEERSRKLRLPGRSKQEVIFGCAAERLMFVAGDAVVE